MSVSSPTYEPSCDPEEDPNRGEAGHISDEFGAGRRRPGSSSDDDGELNGDEGNAPRRRRPRRGVSFSGLAIFVVLAPGFWAQLGFQDVVAGLGVEERLAI